jgi:hypothetical protein
MGDRLEVADVFCQHGQEFLKRWGDTLSPQQRKAFRDIGACRTAGLGTQVQQCDHCGHQGIAYRSCYNRHCPKCHSRHGLSGCGTGPRRFCPFPIVTSSLRCLGNWLRWLCKTRKPFMEFSFGLWPILFWRWLPIQNAWEPGLDFSPSYTPGVNASNTTRTSIV